ncbi:MAG: nucleotidyltransferase domain-containing protein [archaeon]|nr:nucleotidyltransferase domain-containing protein [archaeon]
MINRKQIIKYLEIEKEKLRSMGVLKIGLFGSFIKGKQKKKSDVDILVSFNYINFDRYAELAILLEKLLKRKVDLVLESDLRPELNYIKKEVEYARI